MSDNDLQRKFLETVQPRVERWARFNFKRDDDAVAEAVALAWKWTLSLHDRGRDASAFPCKIAQFAVKAVRSGRRVTGILKPNDVLSTRAQQKHQFTVSKLPEYSTESSNPIQDALVPTTQAPVDEQAAFRLDFPAWRDTFDERRQQIIDALAMNHRTQDVARTFNVSESRISQMRSELKDSWNSFHSGGMPA